MKYLADDTYKPEDPKTLSRVLRASGFLKLDSQGRLWIDREGQPPRQVPLLRDRRQMIRKTMVSLAFPHGSRLYQLLRS